MLKIMFVPSHCIVHIDSEKLYKLQSKQPPSNGLRLGILSNLKCVFQVFQFVLVSLGASSPKHNMDLESVYEIIG